MIIFKKFYIINEATKKEKLLTEVISKLESLGYLVKIKSGRAIAYTKEDRMVALKNILKNFKGSKFIEPTTSSIRNIASIGYILLNNGISVVVKPLGVDRKKAEKKALNKLDRLIKKAYKENGGPITIKIGKEKFRNIIGASSKKLKGDPKADIALIDVNKNMVAYISHKKAGGAAAFQQYGGISHKSGIDIYTNPIVKEFVNQISSFLKNKNLDNTAQPGMSFLKELPNNAQSKKLVGKSVYGFDWSLNGKNFGENFVNCIGQGDPKLNKSGEIYELDFSDEMYTYDDLSWIFEGEYSACLGATYREGRQIKNDSTTINNLRGGIYPIAMIQNRNFIEL